MSQTFTFTVFTATRDRAHTLPRVFTSLCAQSFRDFEWVIVDDGSTDGTDGVVGDWESRSDFPIRYYWQPHGGKGRATNRGVREARGDLFLPLDSDDTCFPHALERFKFHWDSIPRGVRHRFSAVTCLLEDEDGEVCGDVFPAAVLDSDSLEIRDQYRIRGEKWGFQRTQVMREFPFPEFEDEKFVTEGIVWTRIALAYRTRYVNEILGTYIREPDSVRSSGVRTRNPKGATLYYREIVTADYPFSSAFLFRSYANYVRYSLHGRRGFGTARGIKSRMRWLLSIPVGLALYVQDRYRRAVASGGARVKR